MLVIVTFPHRRTSRDAFYLNRPELQGGVIDLFCFCYPLLFDTAFCFVFSMLHLYVHDSDVCFWYNEYWQFKIKRGGRDHNDGAAAKSLAEAMAKKRPRKVSGVDALHLEEGWAQHIFKSLYNGSATYLHYALNASSMTRRWASILHWALHVWLFLAESWKMFNSG